MSGFFEKLREMLKKEEYPENAKYKKGEFVRFRYRNEVTHGFVYDARVSEEGILYTLQMGGECPSFAYNYKEENIIGRI